MAVALLHCSARPRRKRHELKDGRKFQFIALPPIPPGHPQCLCTVWLWFSARGPCLTNSSTKPTANKLLLQAGAHLNAHVHTSVPIRGGGHKAWFPPPSCPLSCRLPSPPPPAGSSRHGCHVVGRKEAQLAVQAASPPGRVGAIQHLQHLSAAEAQLVVLQGLEIIQRPGPAHTLWG